MTIAYRRASAADAGAIAAVQARSFDLAWSAFDIEALLESDPSVSLIASDAGVCCAFVVGRIVVDEAEILSIATRPDIRGKGLAGRLLALWMGAIRDAGATRAFLEVADDNEPARRLYERAGFRITGRRPDYYHRRDGATGDALLMMWELSGPGPG
jgi:ribosomal-protein-alanine N-acetyltransferase